MKNLVFLSDIWSFQDNLSFLMKFLVSWENLGFQWNTQFFCLNSWFLKKTYVLSTKTFDFIIFEEKLGFSCVNPSFLKKTKVFSRKLGFSPETMDFSQRENHSYGCYAVTNHSAYYKGLSFRYLYR